MNNDLEIELNGIKIDSLKVQKILTKLIMREKTNLKTKQMNDGQMVIMIKKMIEEEVRCY